MSSEEWLHLASFRWQNLNLSCKDTVIYANIGTSWITRILVNVSADNREKWNVCVHSWDYSSISRSFETVEPGSFSKYNQKTSTNKRAANFNKSSATAANISSATAANTSSATAANTSSATATNNSPATVNNAGRQTIYPKSAKYSGNNRSTYSISNLFFIFPSIWSIGWSTRNNFRRARITFATCSNRFITECECSKSQCWSVRIDRRWGTPSRRCWRTVGLGRNVQTISFRKRSTIEKRSWRRTWYNSTSSSECACWSTRTMWRSKTWSVASRSFRWKAKLSQEKKSQSQYGTRCYAATSTSWHAATSTRRRRHCDIYSNRWSETIADPSSKLSRPVQLGFCPTSWHWCSKWWNRSGRKRCFGATSNDAHK